MLDVECLLINWKKYDFLLKCSAQKKLKAELKFGEIATNIVLDFDRQGFCDISKNKV